jgi:hypothetical protein
MNKTSFIGGARVKGGAFFRPTTMSLAMKKAGLIPDVHLVKDNKALAILRNRNDNLNQRPSIRVPL